MGTLSNVGFVEEANWTRDWRRTMEIMVVLFVQSEFRAIKLLTSGV